MNYPKHSRRRICSHALWLGLLVAALSNFSFAQSDADEILKVDTTIVTVAVRAFDVQGRSLVGLTKQDFRIFEDKAQQEIVGFDNDNSPITVALMLDISDSAQFKLSDIQNAAIAFLGKLRAQDRVIIFTFDKNLNRVYEGATTDGPEIARRVYQIKTGGGTSLYEAVEAVANRDLKKYRGKKAILLLTDGVDTGSKQTWTDSLTTMRESDAPVYVIQYQTAADLQGSSSNSPGSVGLNIVTSKGEPLYVAYERGTRYLNQISGNSGGRSFPADSLVNLSKHFEAIVDELSHTYSISYYPTNESKGVQLRKIKIEVAVPNGKLRYRTAYLPRPDKK